ncbi:ARM repeat superfamily protein [Wolffia australiana]
MEASDWEGLLVIFANAADRGSEDQQLIAIHALRRLCNRAPELILRQTIPFVVGLIESSSSSVGESAARCLISVARFNAGSLCSAVGVAGGVESIISLLPRSDGAHQRSLARCLILLLESDVQNRSIFGRSGGLSVILRLIPLSAEENKDFFFEILSAAALSREVRRAVVRFRGVPILIQALSRGPFISRARAAQAVGLMAMGGVVRRRLVDSGAVPALFDLIRHGNPPAKLTAANSLGVIASHVENLPMVTRAGAIPLYSELLQGEDPLGKEIAEDVLCILAVVEDYAVQICEQLVRILRGDDEEAKAAAADVICGISSHRHSVSVIEESGAVPLLLGLLMERREDVREAALGAIVQMSYDDLDRVALAEKGAVDLLIGLMSGSEIEVLKEEAVEALINFSEDSAFCDRVSQVADDPLFQSVRSRLARIRSADEELVRSLRQLSVDRFASHP